MLGPSDEGLSGERPSGSGWAPVSGGWGPPGTEFLPGVLVPLVGSSLAFVGG
jgi:hypothetical protein